jgi:hypothetical protein
MAEWKHMTFAPRDGTRILVLLGPKYEKRIAHVYWVPYVPDEEDIERVADEEDCLYNIGSWRYVDDPHQCETVDPKPSCWMPEPKMPEV